MEDLKKSRQDEESDEPIVIGIIPKKRGRPSNPDKVKKPPSGRGRGRPAKNAAKHHGDGSDDDDALANGEVVVPTGRGRPPKQGKGKLSHVIEATGKGRGRPKNPPKSEPEDEVEEDEADEGDDDGDVSDYKPSGSKTAPKKGRKAISPKKGGRPKKVKSDDSDESDTEKQQEERRSVGRPSTGGVNLNISRTERGQGRPKKAVAEKRVSETSNGATPKKRGRPAGTTKTPFVPSGKPRGRPKSNPVSVPVADSPDESDDDDDNSGLDDEKAKQPQADEDENANDGSQSNDDDDADAA